MLRVLPQKIITIHPKGGVNVCAECHGKPETTNVNLIGRAKSQVITRVGWVHPLGDQK